MLGKNILTPPYVWALPILCPASDQQFPPNPVPDPRVL